MPFNILSSIQFMKNPVKNKENKRNYVNIVSFIAIEYKLRCYKDLESKHISKITLLN